MQNTSRSSSKIWSSHLVGKSFAFQHFQRVVCHDLAGFRLHQNFAVVQVRYSSGKAIVRVGIRQVKRHVVREFEATQCLVERQVLAHEKVNVFALEHRMVLRLQNHHWKSGERNKSAQTQITQIYQQGHSYLYLPARTPATYFLSLGSESCCHSSCPGAEQMAGEQDGHHLGTSECVESIGATELQTSSMKTSSTSFFSPILQPAATEDPAPCTKNNVSRAVPKGRKLRNKQLLTSQVGHSACVCMMYPGCGCSLRKTRPFKKHKYKWLKSFKVSYNTNNISRHTGERGEGQICKIAMVHWIHEKIKCLD